MHTGTPVNTHAFVVLSKLPYLAGQLAIRPRLAALRTATPIVIAAPRHPKQTAHGADRMQAALALYPRVLHTDPFAKYAAAFFSGAATPGIDVTAFVNARTFRESELSRHGAKYVALLAQQAVLLLETAQLIGLTALYRIAQKTLLVRPLPAAKNRPVDAQVTRRPRDRQTLLRHKFHRLDLELVAESTPLLAHLLPP